MYFVTFGSSRGLSVDNLFLLFYVCSTFVANVAFVTTWVLVALQGPHLTTYGSSIHTFLAISPLQHLWGLHCGALHRTYLSKKVLLRAQQAKRLSTNRQAGPTKAPLATLNLSETRMCTCGRVQQVSENEKYIKCHWQLQHPYFLYGHKCFKRVIHPPRKKKYSTKCFFFFFFIYRRSKMFLSQYML